MFDEFAKLYFQTPEEYAEARMMLQRFESATSLTSLSTRHIKEFFKKYGEDAAEKIGKARRVIEVRRSENLQAPGSSQHSVPKSVNAAIALSVPAVQSPSISSLVDKFIDSLRRKNSWGPGNSSEEKYRHALKYFVELIDKPADDLVKADIVKVKDLLLKLPDLRKHPNYRKLTTRELSKEVIPHDHTISNNTIKQHSDRISTFITWLYDNDYCSVNLSRTLTGIVKTTRKQGKAPYSSDQLRKLFNENFRQLDDTQYWVPLIGLHTGARINEICQLDTKDIKEIDGIWVFDIAVDSGDQNKRVKREASKRIIPIHHRLLELGFLKYVKAREDAKKRKLFNVSFTVKNGYSGAIGHQWLRWQEKCGVSGNVSFHSFRKTVINYFNQTLELPEIAHAYYTGHAPEGNEGIKSYTSQKPLNDAQAMFDRLEYDIDYSGLMK
jgi:integrase